MPLRVRCHECDGQGTVSNANYLAYAEANLRYLVPCRFEDDLVVTRSSGTSGLSVVLDFEIHRGKQRVIGAKVPGRGGGPLRPNGCQPDVGTPGL